MLDAYLVARCGGPLGRGNTVTWKDEKTLYDNIKDYTVKKVKEYSESEVDDEAEAAAASSGVKGKSAKARAKMRADPARSRAALASVRSGLAEDLAKLEAAVPVGMGDCNLHWS